MILLDWFEVDLGFTELSFIQIDLFIDLVCVLCLYAHACACAYEYVRVHMFACLGVQRSEGMCCQQIHIHVIYAYKHAGALTRDARIFL